MVSVDDLESEIASGVTSAGLDGDLSDGLDWWTGIGYYDSSGWSHCSPGHIEEVLRWERVTRGRRVNLKGDLDDVAGIRAL